MTTALIISTYNRPDALWLTLLSILQQTKWPDEIIIADDGSTEATKSLLEEFKLKYGLELMHVWHEDKGFRLSAIRNRAIAVAKSEYIIQIDGDLILHRNFIQDHIQWARPNRFVAGTRCLISEALTHEMLKGQHIDLPGLTNRGFSKKYNGFRCTMLSALMYTFSTGSDNFKYVLGCNMAFWKEALIKVNGYNENFKGWGKEDNDIAIRLKNTGQKLRFVKFNAIVYHLYHKEAPRELLSINETMIRESLHNKITYVEEGIAKYFS